MAFPKRVLSEHQFSDLNIRDRQLPIEEDNIILPEIPAVRTIKYNRMTLSYWNK
jgi:hypothetical protein